MISCMCTSQMFHSGPRITALVKYFKHIEPSIEKRIQSALPTPDYPLARLMPSSAMKAGVVYRSLVGAGYLYMHL